MHEDGQVHPCGPFDDVPRRKIVTRQGYIQHAVESVSGECGNAIEGLRAASLPNDVRGAVRVVALNGIGICRCLPGSLQRRGFGAGRCRFIDHRPGVCVARRERIGTALP